MTRPLTPLNYLLLVVGIAIVWFTTHSVVACLGAFVASIHVTVRIQEAE